MRHTFLIFGFAIILSTFVYGQDNRFIYSKQVSNATARSNEILQRSREYVSVDFVGIDLERIQSNDEFILQFGGRNINIKKKRLEVRGIRNFCFSGKNETNGTDIVITVLDNVILGTLSTPDAIYEIITLDNNEYAVIRVDLSELEEDCDDLLMEGESEEEDDELNDVHTNENVINNNPNDTDDIQSNNLENNDTQEIFFQREKSLTSVCKIRILVLYTPAAETYNSNIKVSILHAIDLTNESFTNSNINYQVELAYAGKTIYTEDNAIKDLRRFAKENDGFMDEVHALRDKYTADVCVLVSYVNDTDYPCGRARRIGPVSEKNAFCIVKATSCLTSNYSFGHEIGHLLGCRHDYGMDANLIPHTYCHGYINPSKTWRTIMAYSNKCSGCQRLKYWSNPNVYYYTGEVMGTSNLCNNARIWNEHSDDIMTFRQPVNNLTFTNSDFANGAYGDVVAKQNITTSGTVNVGSGNTLHMTAGNTIRLLPGFRAEAGSEFSAKIENIDDCGSTKSNAPKILVQSMQEEENDEMLEINKMDNSKINFSYKVYPNPSNEFINIQYSLDTEIQLSIELVNMLGQKIKTILPQQNQQTGSYEQQIPISNFSTGTYFLIFRSTNQTKTEKIIINK